MKLWCWFFGHKWKIGFFWDNCAVCKERQVGSMTSDEFINKLQWIIEWKTTEE